MSLSDSRVKICGAEEGEQNNESFDFNTYATKKTIAKGLLDVGLLMSNASQLKTTISLGSSHEYFSINIVLIAVSVILQVVVGIMLLIVGCMKGENMEEKNRANKLNNFTVGIVLMITVINAFIAAFGVQASD
ncbi:ninjurin-2-like [Mercenaria mercenaria]|uniref:ninjurin-2-like n=1 Tax=Mercenaria mercenaria TaxID=6596 RepID=UPI00234F73A5|nr:ninjurin-2-like [Mercenaria mercenaria]